MENVRLELTIDEANFVGELVSARLAALKDARQYAGTKQGSDYTSTMMRVQHDHQLAENVNLKLANSWF